MENNKCFIYVVKDPSDMKIRYVGQTSRGMQRFTRHLSDCKIRNRPINLFIRNLIENNKKPIFEPIEFCTLDNVDEREIYWIAYYKSIYSDLLNLCPGGKTSRGFKMPREIVERIRIKLRGKVSFWKGKKIPEESKIKMSESRKGKFTGEDNPFYGKSHSEEFKKRMSDIQTGRIPINCKKIKLLNTGEIFESSHDAARKLGLKASSIRSVLQGKSKALRGLVFIYE